MLTSTEENYLKAIFKLSGSEKRQVSTNAIAEQLHTSAASVTDMIRKLSEKNIIDYQKYRGVSLTNDGEPIAKNLIRKHRLWEVFLVEKLGLGWEEVHEIAEQLEHIKSKVLIGNLDKFLGHPRFDPHGDPIPDEKGNIEYVRQIYLSDLKKGDLAIVTGVKDSSDKFLKYLNSVKISLGAKMEVLEKIEYDSSLMIKIDDSRELAISDIIAQNLCVKI